MNQPDKNIGVWLHQAQTCFIGFRIAPTIVDSVYSGKESHLLMAGIKSFFNL
jgi:hypothetical protein